MFDETDLAELGETVKDAVAVLREVARTKSESGEVRVQAARAILEFATELLSLGQSAAEFDEDFEDEDE